MGPAHAVVADLPAARIKPTVRVRERLAAYSAGIPGYPVHLRYAFIAKGIRTASVNKAAANRAVNV